MKLTPSHAVIAAAADGATGNNKVSLSPCSTGALTMKVNVTLDKEFVYGCDTVKLVSDRVTGTVGLDTSMGAACIPRVGTATVFALSFAVLPMSGLTTPEGNVISQAVFAAMLPPVIFSCDVLVAPPPDPDTVRVTAELSKLVHVRVGVPNCRKP